MSNPFILLKNTALKHIVTTAVRHGLTALGVYLTSRGYADDADWSSVALDLAPILVSVLWSILDRAAEDRQTDALKTAVLIGHESIARDLATRP